MLSEIKYIGILVLALWLISCSDKETEFKLESDALVSHELVGTKRAIDLQGLIKLSGLDFPVDERLLFDVEVYNVVYRTTFKNEEIEVSEKVFIPKQVKANIATVVFSHGTIASDAEAFSNLATNTSTVTLLSGLAGMGMIVVAPDLIGFGASSEYYHPYYVEEVTATTTIDGVYAAKLLADELDLKTNDHLYLAGYSQGGFSTMATHKWIEQAGIDYYNLKASFPAAGGYDIAGVEDFFFEQDLYSQPYYLAFVANAYYNYYDWTDLRLQDIFNEPYASIIPDLFDGSYTGEEINDQLNDTVSVLINPNYLNNPDGAKYTDISLAYSENSPTGWIPGKPVYMYHGDADITVPYNNSVDVYNEFKDLGASPVSFATLSGGTHATGVSPYLESFVSILISLEYE